MIACVLLTPWALHVAQRQHPGVPLAILSQGRRVSEANVLALDAGVTLSMTSVAALSRCPELHLEPLDPPALQVAWRELQETLYARYSPRVDGAVPGLAYLHATPSQARELAAALSVPVGLAPSQEVAYLAALRAQPGEVREVPADDTLFLSLTPTAHLHVLGLNASQLEKLEFLGMRGLADLLKWSAAQRQAFLGVDTSKRLQRFLKGERTTKVAAFVPSEVIEATLSVDAPLTEPGQAEAALADLMPPLLDTLRNRTCAYLTIKADTVAGILSETIPLKVGLDERGLVRAALVALERSDALLLGVDRLEVQLSGLMQPARQVGLWPDVRELDAVRAVLDRFPQGLVKVQWRDVHAYAADARYAWVDWLSGVERFTPMTPPPQQIPVAVPRSGHTVPLFGAEA
ncbi:Y-family DNA polymerase [Deinococcus sp.]|uniref:Y-family DNA polymerase n=1 Tax=Deinococcus sp. TaxID=47478 RepID=UPI003B5B1445